MSDFTWMPIYTPVRTKKPRVLTAQFGDGYEQRVGDGINTTKEMWDLTFRGTRAEIDAIDAFLASKNGVTSFTWTPEGYDELTVVCDDWTTTIISANTASLTTKFRQVFE